MPGKKTQLSWLGAEALPGGLAEINRVQQAWLDAAARHRRYVEELRQRGFGGADTRWTKPNPPLFR
jgi:hypothetical protein